MIYFLAHSDWILYNSRKEIASKLRRLNYKVAAITNVEEYSRDLESYFNKFYKWNINRNKLINIRGIINLRKILKKIKTGDILHIFSLKSGLYFLFASHFFRKEYKTVLSITGLGYLFSNNTKSKFLRNILRFYMKYFFNKKIDVLIFQNDDDQKVFTNYVNYKNRNLLIKGSGVNLKSFEKKKIKPQNADLIKIIMCCRLLRDKGVDEFFKLSQLISDERYKFYLAGSTDTGNPASFKEKEILHLTRKYNITYLGWINAETEMKNYDISICMSYHEGLPRIVLESLYIGLYTVSNKLPGLRSIFDKNDYGELISSNSLEGFKNSILRYSKISNYEEKVSYSRNKIEQNFSTDKILSEFVEVYKNL